MEGGGSMQAAAVKLLERLIKPQHSNVRSPLFLIAPCRLCHCLAPQAGLAPTLLCRLWLGPKTHTVLTHNKNGVKLHQAVYDYECLCGAFFGCMWKLPASRHKGANPAKLETSREPFSLQKAFEH